jgi:D-cysteine desulfhydrase
MRHRGATGMVMYGDLRSNLCRVLAMRCAQDDIPAVMVATDADEEGDGGFNAHMVRNLGVDIVTCLPGDIAGSVDVACDLLRDRGLEPYYIYGTRLGTGNEGVLARAYAQVYREICAWEEERGIRFDLICVPYGTGSTMGGLVAGSLERGDGREIVGISISSRTPERALSILRSAVCDYFEKQGQPVPDGVDDALHIEFAYNCGGYGVLNERIAETISAALAQAALPLDPVYSGKAFLGMRDYLRDNNIQGKRILFIHTGGLPIFFDYVGGTHEEHAC